MKQTLLVLCLCLLIMYGGGCATIFTYDSQNRITFDSTPEGAHIKVGPYECNTPCALAIPKNQNYIIEATYNEQKKITPLTKKIAASTFFNIIFWPGFLVDAITGNIKKYDPDYYTFTFSTPKVVSPKVVSQGTGFAISSEGHIVTAYHIIEGAKTIKVYSSKEVFLVAQIVHGDPMNDLAVLKVEKSTPNFLQVAPMRSAKTGDRVFTIGFPVASVLGREAKYTEGVVSSLSGPKGASSFLQITVPVQPGNSGGPLISETGRVVGIITSTAAILPFIKESGTLPQNVNWAVKADYLIPLIELPKAEQEQLNREQVITLVKKSTFLIEAE